MLLANNAQESIVQEHRKKENGAPVARKLQCEFDPSMHTTATTHTRNSPPICSAEKGNRCVRNIPSYQRLRLPYSQCLRYAISYLTLLLFSLAFQSRFSQSRFSKRSRRVEM